MASKNDNDKRGLEAQGKQDDNDDDGNGSENERSDDEDMSDGAANQNPRSDDHEVSSEEEEEEEGENASASQATSKSGGRKRMRTTETGEDQRVSHQQRWDEMVSRLCLVVGTNKSRLTQTPPFLSFFLFL